METNNLNSYNFKAPRRKLLVNPGHRRKVNFNDHGLIICQDEEIVFQIESFTTEVNDVPKAKYDAKLAYQFQSASIYSNQIRRSDSRAVKPIELSSVTLDSTKEIKISDHIIVTGQWDDVILFIQKLRKYPLKKVQTVVILSTSEPSDSQWPRLSHLPSIFLVRGAATDHNDLMRAGIENAGQFVILGTDTSVGDVSVDSKPIMTFRLAKRHKSFPIICISKFFFSWVL